MTLKRYQVFVSSTYKDLMDERAAVTNCLLDNDCIPVGMEQFPAMPMSQWEYIKKMIDSSDYYLLILAGRYGSVDSQSGLSYTEKEFQYALEQGIPIIAFLYEDINKLPLKKRELTVKGRKNIERFRQIVKESNLLCDFYTTIDSLKYVVAISIRRTIEECPAVGWVRSNQINDFQTQTIKQLQDILIMMKNTQLEQKQILCENISVEANTLLRGACKESAGGIIIVARTLSGTSVSVGKQVFCDEATSCLEAVWISAIEELVKKEYIQDCSGKKELYRVTRSGYEYNNKSDISKPLREKELDDIDIAIVNTMKTNSECTVSEISNMIGYSQRATIRRIQKLKEKGIIERIGNSRFGKWNLR